MSYGDRTKTVTVERPHPRRPAAPDTVKARAAMSRGGSVTFHHWVVDSEAKAGGRWVKNAWFLTTSQARNYVRSALFPALAEAMGEALEALTAQREADIAQARAEYQAHQEAGL